MATRSKSSQNWLKEHFNDPFVIKAQKEGLRSRAAYKLEELMDRGKFIRPGMTAVDLGAAPGGWCQMLQRELRSKGRIFALDILEMPSIPGVEFLCGDFREESVLKAFEAIVGSHAVDLVLSDMAPNMSGVESVDQPRSMDLAELARDFAEGHLKPGGTFLVKLFQGSGFDDYLRDLRTRYTKVTMRKPKASRPRSPEVYALATGFKAKGRTS